MSTCHIASIVKGVIETGDGTTHFGSTMGYVHHFKEAVLAGVITHIQTENSWELKAEVTPLGHKWYLEKNMQELKGRCSNWRLGQEEDYWEIEPKVKVIKRRKNTVVKKDSV